MSPRNKEEPGGVTYLFNPIRAMELRAFIESLEQTPKSVEGMFEGVKQKQDFYQHPGFGLFGWNYKNIEEKHARKIPSRPKVARYSRGYFGCSLRLLLGAVYAPWDYPWGEVVLTLDY